MAIVAFGTNPDDWNVDEGILLGGEVPGISLFGNAVEVWAIAQDRYVTVGDAARAFNCHPALVRRAIQEHPLMYVGDGDWIEHEDE